MTRVLVGKRISVRCVKIDKIPNKRMVLDRPLKLAFKHKSKRRTGRLSDAHIDFLYERSTNQPKGISDIHILDIIRDRLKEMFDHDYEVIHDRPDVIRAKTLIGECSDTKPRIKRGKLPKIPRFSAAHGGQSLTMVCKEASVCYMETHSYEINSSWRRYESN
jgi:hypothetical protein